MTNPQEALAAHAKNAAALLKELGNESRLMVCCCLGDKELSVGELNQMVPLSQSALSQHLARLREADLVATRKEGQTVYYRLQGTNALKLIATLKSIYCPDEL
ncbi:ArsR/SmtB family transcription factor [Teredinibacter turnerae]|uniref:Nodulation protein NolR n=1 Tax=Teredinibacter turnerae (strain ATCC 39867 / T7901) TaxID=377629 RepID=C5BNE6_TERTT|nr:metalloregulator ArsR/SmtB family transcription factor [Teredinibacter turnerae]ACR14019.1 putative nodulation protein NolR [Teredinibacter turnerae T7901]